MHPLSCPRRQMLLIGRPRSTKREISALFPIVVALILLPPSAFASPPDPSWVSGIYDGADGDDIVSLVYDTTTIEVVSRFPVPPLPFSYESLSPSGHISGQDCPAGEFTRGPPFPAGDRGAGRRAGTVWPPQPFGAVQIPPTAQAMARCPHRSARTGFWSCPRGFQRNSENTSVCWS
jgi:hypothetical protein